MNDNKQQFTWIPFYNELAQVLLSYKDKRKELVKWIYTVLGNIKGVGGKSLIDYLHEEDGSHISDIDPFSVFAIFNRATNSRCIFLEAFKKKFNVSEPVPTDFNGIPVVDARRSFFFSWKADNQERIENIWVLFEKALNKEDFSKEFNYLIAKQGISYGITMCLFWICPYTYLSLDSRNRDYLNTIGFNITTMPNYETYLSLIKQVKQKMEDASIPYKDFPELSFSVWQNDTQKKKVWIWSVGKPEDVIANEYIETGELAKDLGDLSKFKTKEEFGEAYRKLKNNSSFSLPNTYWDFMKNVSIGDIIVINQNIQTNGKCIHNLYGWGIVESDCEYLTEGDYRIRRKIKWTKPLRDSPIPCTELHDKASFHKTSAEQALHVMQLLGINQDSTQMTNKHQKYIDLLKANHNIIFNGAPGTGKTYLAKEIVKEMGATYKMVQFHPSYDYTDFVEGLRPVKDDKGNIGFERKDGVFKEFCREALYKTAKNYTEAQIEQGIEQFRRDMDGKNIPSFKNPQNRFGVRIDGDLIKIIPMNKLANYDGKTLSLPTIKISEVIDFIKNGFAFHSYEPSVGQYILEHYLKENLEIPFSQEKKPFVFIIDEINRGEISKIFGELFFSIDPGYRGEKGKVQTQYQNLVEDGDVFKDGFYVPENVYIIGTMNDIDRSVESMDFAMRRRFAWQEITAEESADNMGITGELRERMDSLNKVIEKTEGLGSSYQVGAAIFKKVKDTEENVEGNCGMTVESLWNLNLKSLLKEYLRGLPNEKEILQEMENAYFLKNEETSDNTGNE